MNRPPVTPGTAILPHPCHHTLTEIRPPSGGFRRFREGKNIYPLPPSSNLTSGYLGHEMGELIHKIIERGKNRGCVCLGAKGRPDLPEALPPPPGNMRTSVATRIPNDSISIHAMGTWTARRGKSQPCVTALTAGLQPIRHTHPAAWSAAPNCAPTPQPSRTLEKSRRVLTRKSTIFVSGVFHRQTVNYLESVKIPDCQ
jgi:hypothetical protein